MNDDLEYGISKENLLKNLPSVLDADEGMKNLAIPTAKELAELPGYLSALYIYRNIDTMSEELLDILAYDFKVDWYNYDYPLEVKRRVLKTSFYVHRHLGTRAAVDAALSAVWPNTTVEEWFEYGGEPYWFRVILDADAESYINVSNDDILDTIFFYKSLRSHLDGNSAIYHNTCHIVILTHCGWVVYSAPLCGTRPNRARQGGRDTENIIIETDSDGTAYAVPITGEALTGTHPYRATQGVLVPEGIEVGTESGGTGYGVRLAGLYPPETVDGGAITADAAGDGVAYNVRMCGSDPGSLI